MKSNYTHSTALQFTEAVGGLVKFELNSTTQDIIVKPVDKGKLGKAGPASQAVNELILELQTNLSTGTSVLFEKNGHMIRARGFGALDAVDNLVEDFANALQQNQARFEAIYQEHNIPLPSQSRSR